MSIIWKCRRLPPPPHRVARFHRDPSPSADSSTTQKDSVEAFESLAGTTAIVVANYASPLPYCIGYNVATVKPASAEVCEIESVSASTYARGSSGRNGSAADKPRSSRKSTAELVR